MSENIKQSGSGECVKNVESWGILTQFYAFELL